MTEHPQRRAEDRAEAAQTAEPAESDIQSPASPRRRRIRSFFNRFRQSLIGLGLVGAATPMVRTTKAQSKEPARREDVTSPAPMQQPTSAPPGQDLEDRIATELGETRADTEREAALTRAIDRYGIGRELAEDIYDIAIENGIDPAIAFGLVKTESTFNPRAISHVGARGLTQVMPRTARWLMPGTRADDLYDRRTNLRLGFKYLNQLVDKYRGDVKLALTAYNRGPGTVDRVLKRGGDPDNGYAGKVLGG
ncbi:MAG TPA: lytic transglycosylase domain-containing protein [Longimicrobiales bacterium]|nr:lytic transglycosylase domain-containing protein [Longimicrobiales bacterium]